ncbi:MAG: hypothetical protein C4557_11455 [Anaerolineaceae bacterium]|nr:MAG: hypothetical protein C4557_11455 [Anaerolineaceae bacterium]
MHRKLLSLLFFGILFLAGCRADIEETPQIATPDFVTATLPSTPTPKPTSTAIPPSPAPTPVPVEGTTTAELNVRSEPSTAGENLGTLAPFSKVQIIGRDSFGAWYLIVQAEAPAGQGWINAKYVQVEPSAEIMVVEVGSGSGSGVSGLAILPINVRRGPGTDYESLGKLSPDDVVTVRGRDSSGAWLEIEFKGGAGWVSAEFMQVEDADFLPVRTEQAAGEETEVPATQTTGGEFIPAVMDGDSMQSPSVAVVISSADVQTFQFSGSVSAPTGDGEDWIQFELMGDPALVEVKCTGGAVEIMLHKDGRVTSEHKTPCNQTMQFVVWENGMMKLQVRSLPDERPQSTNYTLKLKAIR